MIASVAKNDGARSANCELGRVVLVATTTTSACPIAPSVLPSASGQTGGPPPFINWPTYLFDASHSSFNAAATAITPSNAGTLIPAWNWLPDRGGRPGQPPPQLFAGPTVVNGVVY